jgi:hypothetical protein
VRAIHKQRSIPHAKYGFIDVKHLHISQQCLVEQLHRDRCNFVWRDNYEMRNLKCCATMVLESEQLENCEQLEMLCHNGLGE